MKNIKRIKISQAEGEIKEVNRNQNKFFTDVNKAQSWINMNISKPEIGYNKVDVWIDFADGDKHRIRYDHGHNDPDLKETIKYYFGKEALK